jgi:hypothetical protein
LVAVRPGSEANELSVRAASPRLTFVVNGTGVATVEDAAPSNGVVGVFGGGDFNDVALERFRAEALD